MLNEPRTYRHSPIQIGLVVVIFITLGIVLLTTMDRTDYLFLIAFAIFYGMIFLTVLYSTTMKTILSEDGISTQSFLGTKSLRWSEISRVSGRGHTIKLHNFDGDMTVSPNQQVPGYEEVVEWIGIKRPDLFNPLEYGEMKKGWIGFASLAVLAIFLVATLLGFGIFFLKSSEAPVILFVPIVFVVIIFAVFFWTIFSSPQSVTLHGKSLFIKYFFSEKNLLANEITSVDLRFTQTRNGKNYFIALTLISKKVIRITGLNPNLPVVYLVLKNWHKANAAIGLTNQQN